MTPQASRHLKFWAARVGGFFLTVIGLCALGGLLGGILFPFIGWLGGSNLSHEHMLVAGVRSGAFFFLVWAPGVALVREFMRGARERRLAAEAEAGPGEAEPGQSGG